MGRGASCVLSWPWSYHILLWPQRVQHNQTQPGCSEAFHQNHMRKAPRSSGFPLNSADGKFQLQNNLPGFGTGMLQSEILSGLCKMETPEHQGLIDGQPANAFLWNTVWNDCVFTGKKSPGFFLFRSRSQNSGQWLVKIPTQFLQVLSSVQWVKMQWD